MSCIDAHPVAKATTRSKAITRTTLQKDNNLIFFILELLFMTVIPHLIMPFMGNFANGKRLSKIN
jgi:hypothetical protein